MEVEDSRSTWFTPWRFAGLLGLILLSAFPKVLLGLESFYYRDYGVLGYPFVFYHHESFWAGELPLWNPLSNCGAPFLAQWGTMVLYPFSLIYLLFPLPWSLGYFCLAHLFLAGMGMYSLARRWVDDSFAGCVAGVAFVINGATFSSLLWPNYTVALGWMPWVVLAVESAWQKGGVRVIRAGIVSAFQMLSGVPEIILLTWLLLGSLWVVQIVRHKADRFTYGSRVGSVVLLTAALTAAQLLPFFELVAHSHRDAAFTSSKWQMPPWGWANFLVPLFHAFETPQGTFFQHDQAFLNSYYLGAPILVLALWGAWRVKEWRFRVLTVLFFVSIVLALGEAGILFSWFKTLVPMAAIARYPVKFVFLTTFVTPLLAAAAIRYFTVHCHDRATRRSLVIFGALALLLIGLIAGFAWRHPFPYDQPKVTLQNGIVRAFFLVFGIGGLLVLCRIPLNAPRLAAQIGLLALMALDILSHTRTQNPSISTSVFAPGLWQAQSDLPPPQPGISRAMISPEAEERLLHSVITDPVPELLGKRLALWSNLNLLDGIPKVGGSSTLQLRHQMQVQRIVEAKANSATGLIDFLGVSHETAPGQVTEWTLRTNYCPMLQAGQEPVFTSEAKTLDAVRNGRFDPRTEVYLPEEARAALSVTAQQGQTALLRAFSPHRVEFETDFPEPALVTFAQSFYRPWKAYLGDTAVEVWRANHAFQAILVPSGNQQVRLIYCDEMFWLGATLSVMTWSFCIVIGWIRREKRKRD